MLIETDFSESSLGNLDSDPAWAVAAGSVSNLSIVVHGSGKAVASAGGTNRYVRQIDDPATLHQRVEISFTFNSSSANHYTGVLARHVDASNYVLACVIHNRSSLTAYLIERVAGAETTLGTVQWNGALPASPLGGALRLEVIGRRARLWYEQHPRPVADRPPDLAADLSREGSTPGQWGIYVSGTTNARITRFVAGDVPAMVMPPPSTVLVNASSLDYHFTPITAEASDVSPEAVEIEWEVYPADADDYPEAYRDLTAASITRRTLWVRPGYAYDLRCRERLADGTLGDWTTFQRIELDGNKAGVLLPVVPTVQFPSIVPDYVMPRRQETQVGVTISDTGRERLQATWPAPRNSFDLVFENRSAEEAQTLIDFFEQMQGQKTAFAWTHPITGRQYALRFAEDDYTIRYDDQGDEGSIAYMGFSVIEVYLGTISTVLLNVTRGEASTVDPDDLVDALNDRAEMAVEPAYQMTRTLDEGSPLSAGEFNTLSAKVAYLAQNIYVSDYFDPDSFGDYQAVTAATDAEVTDRRLVDLRTAIQKMKYVRRTVAMTPHHFAQVSVSHAAYSEENTDAAYDLVEDYWGQNTTVITAEGFTVTASAGPINGGSATFTPGFTPTGGTAVCDALVAFLTAPLTVPYWQDDGSGGKYWLLKGSSFADGADQRRWMVMIWWDGTTLWQVMLTTELFSGGTWVTENTYEIDLTSSNGSAAGFTSTVENPTSVYGTACGVPTELTSGGVTTAAGGTRAYNQCFYLVRASESAGALAVDAYIYNAQVSFDFSAYQGTSARIFIKAAVCVAPDTEGEQVIPGRSFHDILDCGIGGWFKLQDVPGEAMRDAWVGDVLPSLGDFDTTTSLFDGDGLSVTTSERIDKPAGFGETLTVSNEIRGQFAASEAVGFALDWSDETNLPFGTVTYANVAARELTPTDVTAAAGFTIRNQDAFTNISLLSVEITDTGQLAVLIEKTSANRILLSAVSSDSIFRVIGSARSDGSASTINEIIFDGCTGKIEVMGTSGTIRYCYVNQHVGGYEEIVSAVDGQDGVRPGVSFIRGMPLDLVTSSDAPEALPLVYPEPETTMSMGWILKEAVILIEVPSAIEIGTIQTW